MKNFVFLFTLLVTIFTSSSMNMVKIPARFSPEESLSSAEDLRNPSEDIRNSEEVNPYEIKISGKRRSVPKGCPPISYCPLNTVPVFDRCYRFVFLSLTWEDAKKDCEAQGGILAIPNFEYNNTVFDLSAVYRVITGRQVWIGACNNVSEWNWINNETLQLNHSNWLVEHPRCAALYNLSRVKPMKIVGLS
ncbi:hypothetical protein Anas_06304, partial [Armadillidium nasatum]